jgi:serine/threonine protein kinase
MRVLWVKSIEEVYDFGKQIGSGQYGCVFEAVNRETDKPCVCKVVKRETDYVREVDHLIALRKVIGVLPVRQIALSATQLCMEFERARGNLCDYLDRRRVDDVYDMLIESTTIVNQILITMAHVHANHIVHRDMKPDNIVYGFDEKGIRVHLIDFGMSRRTMGADNVSLSGDYEIVTQGYRAPEVWLDPWVKRSMKYDSKIDVWAIGCILYELVTGDMPFQDVGNESTRSKLGRYVLHRTGAQNLTSKIELGPLDIVAEMRTKVEEMVQKVHRNAKVNDDICDQMKSLAVSTKPLTRERFKKIQGILGILEQLLSIMTDPNPATRATAIQALRIFGDLDIKKERFVETPVNLQLVGRFGADEIKRAVAEIPTLFLACDYLRFNPFIAYLGLWIWLRTLTTTAQGMELYRLYGNRLLVSATKIACGYCKWFEADFKKFKKTMLEPRELPQQHTFAFKVWSSSAERMRTPKQEVNASSAVIAALQGRIWTRTPADYRHAMVADPEKWNSAADEAIFHTIISFLNKDFRVPADVHEIMNVAGRFLAQKSS